MALILSIETATSVCSIAIHQQGNLVGSQCYHIEKSHATLLPEIIKQLLENCGKNVQQLEAVAVSGGPGSYTGLRIGTAVAKGLSYSLQVPLIAVNTLDTMSGQLIQSVERDALLCPMIDARRMEVYCYLKDTDGNFIWKTTSLILDENAFAEYAGVPVYLFGEGADKGKEVFQSANIRFVKGIFPQASFMGELAYEKFISKEFEDVAYFEPDYLKEYKTHAPVNKLTR